MKRSVPFGLLIAAVLLGGYPVVRSSRVGSCIAYALGGWRTVAADRSERFLGKVSEDTARCRGGEPAVAWRKTPWLDWPQYFSAGGQPSRYSGLTDKLAVLSPNQRGINGALLDLEYQRIELLKFNLFDNSGTYEGYVRDRSAPAGRIANSWPQFRFPKGHPLFAAAGGEGPQKCSGEAIRFRTLTGICNDILNPLMGAVDQPFARNADFESTFPELSEDEIIKNRHGDRLDLLKPDPQVISRKLFTRRQSSPNSCDGVAENSAATQCDYKRANHLNVLAAFWVQFMTHDWFSHLDEGRNQTELIATGCRSVRAGAVERPLTPDEIIGLGCRPRDRIDKTLVAEEAPAPRFALDGERKLARAPKTTFNKVTAWWDASQIYGYNETSRRRVKRDPRDSASLMLDSSYLPVLQKSDPQNPQWAGQEAVAFPDNWNIGLSFFHNVFAREHNLFVEAFRRHAAAAPDADSGLRHPDRPHLVIANKNVTTDELFEIARLVVSAEIAKVHTIEWTTQMLYNEPLYLAMNANWSGLLQNYPRVSAALEKTLHHFAGSADARKSTAWYSAFAAGPGIFGLGNRGADINGGVHHFGSPFNFPEEFINAYRLHPMLPDVIELRDLKHDPNAIAARIAVAATLRDKATQSMRQHGIANWALSLGRQRLGALTLHNHPRFLQNLPLPRLNTATGKIDVVALDIVRDRERGIPRYNEFRRQYGLQQLTSFDDFIDPRLPADSQVRAEQQRTVALLRELYGQHRCDATKIITRAQKNADGTPINDCLGHPDGSMVDNIEDADALVGWLAEFVRPHGWAISETQFQVFILNASRRLFSDRFLTSSFRPDFYTHFGIKWVNENGPDGKAMENARSNGHEIEVSPLKRVLLRTIPELKTELDPVINVFDPWARERGEYYSLQWKPRPGAETDAAFTGNRGRSAKAEAEVQPEIKP
ncbi:MAG TPA: peroxidase family protein [Candidatus Binatia bacterium]